MSESIALLTSKVLLVPYSKHHVPTYHEWMKDEDLQRATASEPLTLEEEYAMQRSWRTDHDKLTFIVCTPPATPHLQEVQPGSDAPGQLLGDVNLFLVDDEDEQSSVVGEVELMIARKDYQGQGYGRAILDAFLWYLKENRNEILGEYVRGTNGEHRELPERFSLRAKIGEDNTRSISLFEKMGFAKVREEANFFGEFELRFEIDSVLSGSDLEIPRTLVYHSD